MENQSGIVHAHVDKLRKEKKGFVSPFRVKPEFRGRGVEERLLELAIDELKRRRMNVAQAWTVQSRNDLTQLLDKYGFKLVDVESDMEIELTSIPYDLKKNEQVTLRLLRKKKEVDIKLFNWLRNEIFRGQFNYRPITIEETRRFLVNHPDMSADAQQEWFIAVLDEKNVGFIGVGIDDKRNIERNTRNGTILTLGVLKPYRKKGVGTRLVLHGLETLKARGMTRAMLNVDDFNQTKALELYEKIGFHVTNRYLTYEKNLT